MEERIGEWKGEGKGEGKGEEGKREGKREGKLEGISSGVWCGMFGSHIYSSTGIRNTGVRKTKNPCASPIHHSYFRILPAWPGTSARVQSHHAIPERAEPDTALNQTKSMAALDGHTIHPIEPEKGKFRIRMISRGIPPLEPDLFRRRGGT